MNKNFYRVVFNKARGLLMAVSEIATSHSNTSNTSGTLTKHSVSPSHIATLRPLSFSILLAIGAVGLVSGVADAAGIVADGSAPSNQQPVILNAANGVPQVNIQTPSAAGVSRNTYSQFDVQQQGVILNNSRTDVQTQLGGYVQANPYLAGGAARVILNEVNSNNPSLLQGYIEVAGSRAQVVIANPAGVTCDGCGFINANRATLTTGAPILNGGSLDGYRVQRGTVSITGNGLDASQTDYTDIIARAVQVNASIYANDLRVTAGSNQVNTANTTATSIAGTGTTPTLAIDVAQLGGMYAGKIQLIGTEAGVGVTNAGQIGASAGNVVVNVNGQLTNSGTISSTGNNTVQADSITNTNGSITAGQLLGINANSLSGDGHVLSDGDINVQLTSDYSNTGQLQANGNLTFTTTGNFSNQSDLLAGNLLTLTAANIDNSAMHEISGLNTHLSAGNTLTNRGLIDGSDTFINAATLNNIGTGSIFGDHVALQATTLTNDVETINTTTTAAVIAARNSLDIGATTLNNREHSLIFSSGNTAIGGSLDANHLATGSSATVNNNSATIEALGALSLNANQVNNTNEHFTTQDVQVDSQSFDEFQGQGGSLRYTAPAGMPLVYNFPYCGDDCFNAYSSAHNPNAYATSVRNSLYQWVIGGAQYRNAYRFIYTETTVDTQVLSSDPAQILSGTGMQITANNVLNDMSKIVAGDALTGTIGTLTNTSISGQRTITDSGTTYVYITHDPGGSDNDYTEIQASGYSPAPTVQALSLTPTVFESHTTPTGTNTTIATHDVTLPNSGLFQPNPNPAATYLVETNPQFANYRTWLSSDYLLQQLSFDPATTQKRLGDGFYEQSLVRDQVAQLTGRRFLDGYASDEAEYQGLLTNAVTVAKAWNLQPGVALSAEQVAQLTSDIVWLVKKTVTLPDGTTTEALVPQVYVTVQPGDLNGSGALISGNTTNLNIGSDLNNSGTIAGRTVLALNAVNVNNMGGNITATDVNVNASNDINNIGGTISGKDSLVATAGRDLNVESSTSTQTNSQGSTTNINRVAGLYVSNADAVLIASAGRDVNLNAAQISNSVADTNGTGGTLIQAGNNLNIGTVKTTSQENIVFNNRNNMTQTNTAEVGSNIQTSGNIALVAGQDFNAKAATVNSAQGDVDVVASKNINITTGQSTATSQGNTSYGYGTTKSTANLTTQSGSTISAGNSLTLQSGADTHITSANLNAGNNLAVNTTGNLTIDAAKNTNTLDYDYTAKNKRDIIKNNDETAIGSQLNAGNNVSLNAQAGSSSDSGNLTLNTANINSQNGVVTLNADKNVTIGSTTETHDHFEEHTSKGHGFLSSKSSLSIDQVQSTNVVGSTVSGDTVAINAAKDIAVQGSNVVSTNGTTLNAGENVSITSTQNTDVENHVRETKKSGLMGSGGVGVTIGSRQQSTTGTSNSVVNNGSTVGSTDGDVTINTGKAYTQTGSDVLAPKGNINITAQTVDINAAQNTSVTTQQSKFKQTGITLSVSNPVISAVQTANQMASAASQTSDPRMQALAAGTTALAAKNAYDALGSNIDANGNVPTAGNTGPNDLEHVAPASLADKLGGVTISVSLGTSKSQSDSTQTSSTAQGSNVTAGKDINITATGAGAASNLNVIGSTIQAADNVTLKADNQINLLAAQNTDTQTSTNKSSSASVGLSYNTTTGFAVTASASQGKGKANGTDVSYTNTKVIAGNQTGDKATLQSGTDTNLIGAEVQGNQVVANVGTSGQGNLNIQSLQDISTYNSKQNSAGIGVSIPVGGVGFGVSGNISNSKMTGDYASVNEQSGIKAGDGGFQITTNGNTNLTGAVIASSEQAIINNKNSLTTETLTVSDLQNRTDYSASQTSLGGGYSTGSGGVGKDQQGNAQTGTQVPGTTLPSLNGFSATTPVALSASDSNSSTTLSAISAGNLNITDSTKQQTLIGKDAATTVATLNQDVHVVNTTDANGNTTSTTVDSQGNNTAHSIAPLLTDEKKAEINADFAIMQALTNETSTFLTNRAREATTAQTAFDQAVKNGATSDQLEALAQNMYDTQKWLPGGSYNTLSTALIGAFSGNVTGSTGDILQAAAVNYLQSLAVAEVKTIADNLKSESARTALQAVVGCAGAAATGKNCGTGAVNAASAVVLSNLLDTLTGENVNDLSPTEQKARKDLLNTLITGISTSLGADAQTALLSSQLEIENNQLGKNRQVQVVLGYALGVGASVGSLGLVVTPDFWKGIKLITDSDHPVDLLIAALKSEATERGQDFNMFINQGDDFGAGMVAGRTVADTAMMFDAVGSVATLSIKVAAAGGRLSTGLYEWVLQGGKLNIVGSAASNIYSATKPMEEVFPELAGVNPHYVEDAMIGVNTNCASCANATQARLTGQNIDAVADPSKGYANMNDLLPSAPLGFKQELLSVSAVQQEMLSAGNGAVGVVIIHQPGEILHVINTVNKDGIVYFIDSQRGEVVTLNPDVKLQLGRPL